MIPRSVDIDSIVASLSDATVYIDPSFPGGDKIDRRELQSIINNAKSGASQEKFGDMKIALIGKHLSLTETRDVAQKIKDETHANTVIVKSSSGVAAVADNFSRYNLESNSKKAYGTPTSLSLQSYVQALEEHRNPETLVNPAGLIGLLVAVAISMTAAKLLNKNSQD